LSHLNGSAGEEGMSVAGEHPSRRDRRRRSRRWWPLVLLVVGAFVVVSLVAPFGRHQWAESLVRQPSPYSSLAFVDATDLPTDLVPGQHVEFTFTIGNHESQDEVYRYLVASSPSKLTVLGGNFGAGSVSIPAGQSRDVKVSADPQCAASPCTISVVLRGHAETIDFIVRLEASATTGGPG
jgi:hypothetical protein